MPFLASMFCFVARRQNKEENKMAHTMNRRDILKLGVAAAGMGVLHTASTALAADGASSLLRAGIITDMHQTTKADSDTRIYSAALDKMQAFMDRMKAEKPAFVIELGDFVDTLAKGTDPVANLKKIESIFTSASCPHYHVLGNHDFDNMKRDVFLKNVSNTGIQQGKTWYSWDANGIHFIVLDADYTPKGFRPYDMNTPEDTFWTWKDTIIPPQEMEWLKEDLRKTSNPVVVFSHQTLDRVDEQDHNIKNASAVRALFEESGRVLAVISGHDHQGGYANIKGIHYIVLNGNVGVNDTRPWSATSQANGRDLKLDNQFSILEISRVNDKTYRISVEGYGRQPTYTLERTL